MVRRLPSLNQLRAFEAAARHESIKDGADELCVTPTAVGHQIKALEKALNTTLFHRKTRKVVLTEAGRELAGRIGAALDLMEAATERVTTRDLTGALKITVAPFFGNRWLLPRLPEFQRRHPGLTIEPVLSFDYVDLETEGFDAALRYGDGNWKGLAARQIFQDRIAAVCAPQVIDGLDLPLSVDDILRLPLASSATWREDWNDFASEAGARFPTDVHINEYHSRALMFDAALSGQAAILADIRMTAADENAGRLIRLNPLTVTRPQGIHVATLEGNTDPRIELLVNWLREEAAKFN